MRTYTSFASGDTRQLLNMLLEPGSSHGDYRDTMTALGRRLAQKIVATLSVGVAPVCVACTVEDADFLARGLLEELEHSGFDGEQLKLVCFWNERVKRFNGAGRDSFDIAPIVKEYREDVDIRGSILIVVKSIISGACVVKTNLATLIDTVLPKRVFVVAPVMLEGAKERLGSEFPYEIAKRFEYVTFAIDDEKSADENVLPGIGGSVYERLGLVDRISYVPEIVKLRREKLAHA